MKKMEKDKLCLRCGGNSEIELEPYEVCNNCKMEIANNQKDKLKEKNNQEVDLRVLKVDMDIFARYRVYRVLAERLQFMININLINIDDIEKIETVKKQKYSVKIYLKRALKNPELLILFQSTLGDDWKRAMITLRDYKAKLRHFNRLFELKRYEGGDYKQAEIKDITELIKDKLMSYEEL